MATTAAPSACCTGVAITRSYARTAISRLCRIRCTRACPAYTTTRTEQILAPSGDFPRIAEKDMMVDYNIAYYGRDDTSFGPPILSGPVGAGFNTISRLDGVQARYGDFEDGDSLPTAFAGGERMLLISTLDVGERRRRQHGTAVDAAVAAGVQHIAYTSSVGIHPRSPAFVVADHLHTEELLRRCGVAFTILRDSQYAEVVATMIAPLALASGSRVDNRPAGALVTRRLSRQSGRADS
jgi:hypothetical protein